MRGITFLLINQITITIMKKKLTIILGVFILNLTSKSNAQECETILMNGVFNTFNSYTGNYSSSEWHNFWCNGTVEKSSSSSSSSAGLNLGFAKISLGMSFDDAKEFQRIYQSINCGSNSGATQDYSSNTVIQKVASPEILKAYVDCKKLQSSGLVVDLSLRESDKRVFVVDVKYTGAWQAGAGPKVKKVTFLPNVISTKEGSLQDGVELKSGQTFSMICERTAEYPVTVYVETEVGTFHADLPPTIPPPTDQEKIMAAMPRGTIFGWFDPVKIPKGWVICDGNNGSPNLIERFPVGTGITTNNLGSMFGSETHEHTVTGNTSNDAKDRSKGDGNGLQGEGDECMFHTHTVTGKTDKVSNIPPATRIIFIMKL